MSVGIKRGTRLWVATMQAHHASDPDVVELCHLLLRAWDDLEEIPIEGETDGATESEPIEDEWSSGG